MGLDLSIRERISKVWNRIYTGLPYSSIYRPVSEAVAITPGVVLFLYGNPKVTKVFLQRYMAGFFNEENTLYAVSELPDIKEATKKKMNLIILDEMYDDKATAAWIKEFREKRSDDQWIMFVRAAEGSEIDRLSKVGCETTYVSDAFLPFPRKSPQPGVASREEEKQRIPTDSILYLWITIFPAINIDERRIKTMDKLFANLGRLRYFRRKPESNPDALRRILKTYKRYRSKDAHTISDLSVIMPLVLAPKLLVTGELVKRRLEKAYYYVKQVLGNIDLDTLSEEELLKYSEVGGFVIFDILRFAESIVKYILSS